MVDARIRSQRHGIERMQADALLPEEIRPETKPSGEAPRIALLTGACGFLGRHLARVLLNRTELSLVCLVRHKADKSATTRLARILSEIGISRQVVQSRVEVLVGDLTEPRLGLDPDSYAELAGRVDLIYHCAAQVDWVRGYGQLYRMNVGGVLAMIRLACQGRAKRLVFVSSAAVCYAWGGPERIDEDTDMLPFIADMPLGYARSKCVAEALLRQAAARGLPVTVLRPALIAGDSTTGRTNPNDMIAALIQSCTATGMAMDTDWRLDCVPVDFVAEVMAQVPQGDSNWQVLHLIHRHPRYWRELILWINLHGYAVALVDRHTWIRHLFDEQLARGTLLYAQRRFFLGSPRGGENRVGDRPYEAYLSHNQARIHAERTGSLLKQLGLWEAPLDADLMHRYFADYRRIGLLPKRMEQDTETQALEDLIHRAWSTRGIEGGIDHWATAERKRIGSDDSLLSEIAAAYVDGGIGLHRLQFCNGGMTALDGPTSAVLKIKVSDQLLQDLTIKLALVCRSELGRLFSRFRDGLGLELCHERELALYESQAPGLRQHLPICYGTLRDPAIGRWALLLEYLPEVENGVGLPRLRADDPRMQSVLKGLAQIHSIWYQREEDLTAEPWLVPTPDPQRILEMTPLWLELADFAAPWFETWCHTDIRSLQRHIIADLAQWWPRLQALPATLIHNDFNPRNFVLREIKGESRLCVYDWELATLGVPQHDLAELLCFTWHDGLKEQDLDRFLETYRRILGYACGKEIDPEPWREGFSLALQHLLINRLALYTLMHRFRPLSYLPRVMANWQRLYTWSQIPLMSTIGETNCKQCRLF